MADAPTGWRKLLRDLAVDFIDSGAAAEVLKLVEQSIMDVLADTERPSRMCKCTMEPVMSDPLEDSVPEVGDIVRVCAGASGVERQRGYDHDLCAGKVGRLSLHRENPDEYNAGPHVGPLSDFELVERAEARR